MPSAVSPNPRAGSAQPDELDRLLDYDNAVEDFMNDLPTRNDGHDNATGAEQAPRDEDQEVQVKKKRQPVPKLDDNRLLSDAGIPKLRKITKSRLKFRGKGHEFTDITHLLNTYQLWLDDLYPRAKFRDALTMVEKVGHSKRMQVMRRAWLDDTKPSRRELTPPPDAEMSGPSRGENDSGEAALFGDESRSADQPARRDRSPEQAQDDELDDLLAESEPSGVSHRQAAQLSQRRNFEADEPDEDELDALLAGEQAESPARPPAKTVRKDPFEEEEPDDDELDALLAGENSAPQIRHGGPSAAPREHMDDFADDEEAMADMWP